MNTIKQSDDAIGWFVFTWTMPFHFKIVPPGPSIPMNSCVYGDTPRFIICSKYHAFSLSIRHNGLYDVQVQLHS